MKKKLKGFQVEACFGSRGCPNRVIKDDGLVQSIESLLTAADLRGFLKQTVNGPLKFHHEFRVTLAECPNACSQPQIKDMGIIGAATPKRTDEPCSDCGACVDVCREEALTLDASSGGPVFAWKRCVRCGQCIGACPTGTIDCESRGYRLLIGGKLGRHPRLATEIEGLYDADQVLRWVKWCVRYYKAHSKGGERFADLVVKAGPAFFNHMITDALNSVTLPPMQ